MAQEVAEQEAPQSLEEVLEKGQASEEAEEVSEKPQEPEEVVEPPEVDPEFERRVSEAVQSRSDKMTNEYREKRESDTALIRDLRQKAAEANRQARVRNNERSIASILSGNANEGLSEEETRSMETSLKELDAKYQDLFDKQDEITETVEFISSITEKLDKGIVKEFGLDDPNPGLRASNGMNFVNETITLFRRNVAFQKVVDIVLEKGSEVRQNIEGFTEQLMELSDEKGRDLLLDKIKSGLKVTPKKAPPAPSAPVGGVDTSNLTPTQKIERGLKTKKGVTDANTN